MHGIVFWGSVEFDYKKTKGVMILKKLFKYDYSNNKRNLCLTFLCFAILVFIYLSVTLLDIRSLCIVPFIILFALSAMHYSKKEL